jgi:prefoldin subunit 5
VRKACVLLIVVAALLAAVLGTSAQGVGATMNDWLTFAIRWWPQAEAGDNNLRNATLGGFQNAMYKLQPSGTSTESWFYNVKLSVDQVLIASFWYLFNRDAGMLPGVQASSGTSGGTGASSPSLEAFNALQARVAALEARPAVTTTTTTSGTSADLSQLWAAVNALDSRIDALESIAGWNGSLVTRIGSLETSVQTLQNQVGFSLSQPWETINQTIWEIRRDIEELKTAVGIW